MVYVIHFFYSPGNYASTFTIIVSSRLLIPLSALPSIWRLSEGSYELSPLELLIGSGFGRASINWGAFVHLRPQRQKSMCQCASAL